MSELHTVIWTKQTLAEAVNQRVDRSSLSAQYIFANDISDAALQQFQTAWDRSQPAEREREFTKLYQSIVAGF